MSPKQKVQTLYPKANGYWATSWLYYVRSGTRANMLLDWGDHPRQAWAKAAEKYRLAIKVKRKLRK